MSKGLALLSFFAIVSTGLYAADTAPVSAVKTTAPAVLVAAPAAQSTIVGTVKSIVMADAAKGLKPQVIITGSDSKPVDLLIEGSTGLLGVDGKSITLDKIAANEKIEAVYSVAKDGSKEAASIKIVK